MSKFGLIANEVTFRRFTSYPHVKEACMKSDNTFTLTISHSFTKLQTMYQLLKEELFFYTQFLPSNCKVKPQDLLVCKKILLPSQILPLHHTSNTCSRISVKTTSLWIIFLLLDRLLPEQGKTVFQNAIFVVTSHSREIFKKWLIGGWFFLKGRSVPQNGNQKRTWANKKLIFRERHWKFEFPNCRYWIF